MDPRFAPPASELAASTEPDDVGPRWGMGVVGTLGTLEGVLIVGAVLLNVDASDRGSWEDLLLLSAFGLGVAIPGWGVGRALGRRLQQGGFWRGVLACALASLAWGVGIMACMILAALVKGGFTHTMSEVPLKLMTIDALQVQGGFIVVAAAPTFLGGAVLGSMLAWRRRRARRRLASEIGGGS